MLGGRGRDDLAGELARGLLELALVVRELEADARVDLAVDGEAAGAALRQRLVRRAAFA